MANKLYGNYQTFRVSYDTEQPFPPPSYSDIAQGRSSQLESGSAFNFPAGEINADSIRDPASSISIEHRGRNESGRGSIVNRSIVRGMRTQKMVPEVYANHLDPAPDDSLETLLHKKQQREAIEAAYQREVARCYPGCLQPGTSTILRKEEAELYQQSCIAEANQADASSVALSRFNELFTEYVKKGLTPLPQLAQKHADYNREFKV